MRSSRTQNPATMPVDVVKVRMQYAGADGVKTYSGIADCIAKTAKVSSLGHWGVFQRFVHQP